MNSRERTLALALGGVAALFVGRWLVMDVVLSPIRERQTRLERAEEELERKQFLSVQQMAAIESLRKWKLGALPADQNGRSPSVVYKGYLVELVQKAGLKNPSVSSLPIRQVRNAYSTLPFSISAQCDLAQLSKLLYEFQRTDLLHAIKMIDVRPQINNDRIEHLDAKIDIEVLAFSDAPSREKLEPSSKQDGRKIGDFRFLAEKNFFQPTNVLDREKVVATNRDDRSAVRFYGTVVENRVESYYFINSSTSKLMALTKNDTLDIPGMKAKILGYETETSEVILQVGDKIGSVKSGQTLMTWKERAKPPAAMSLASQPKS
jgi:hypothetical protein